MRELNPCPIATKQPAGYPSVTIAD